MENYCKFIVCQKKNMKTSCHHRGCSWKFLHHTRSNILIKSNEQGGICRVERPKQLFYFHFLWLIESAVELNLSWVVSGLCENPSGSIPNWLKWWKEKADMDNKTLLMNYKPKLKIYKNEQTKRENWPSDFGRKFDFLFQDKVYWFGLIGLLNPPQLSPHYSFTFDWFKIE